MGALTPVCGYFSIIFIMDTIILGEPDRGVPSEYLQSLITQPAWFIISALLYKQPWVQTNTSQEGQLQFLKNSLSAEDQNIVNVITSTVQLCQLSPVIAYPLLSLFYPIPALTPVSSHIHLPVSLLSSSHSSALFRAIHAWWMGSSCQRYEEHSWPLS